MQVLDERTEKKDTVEEDFTDEELTREKYLNLKDITIKEVTDKQFKVTILKNRGLMLTQSNGSPLKTKTSSA